MAEALELTFTLSLAIVTWSGALIAFTANRSGRWWLDYVMIVLLAAALVGGAITLGGVIGARPLIVEGQTEFPATVLYGSRLQWTAFILAMIVFAVDAFIPRRAAQAASGA